MKDINLIPKEILQEKYIKRKKTKTFVKSAIMLCAFISILFIPIIYIQNLNNEKNILENKLISLKSNSDIKSELQDSMNFLELKEKNIKDLSVNKYDITKILNDISSNIPNKVSIISLKFDNNIIYITGETYLNRFVSNFMLNLRKLNYVEDVDLISSQFKENGLNSYTIHMKLKVMTNK